ATVSAARAVDHISPEEAGSLLELFPKRCVGTLELRGTPSGASRRPQCHFRLFSLSHRRKAGAGRAMQGSIPAGLSTRPHKPLGSYFEADASTTRNANSASHRALS